MNVDQVNVETSDGVRLDGIFRKPPQENASRLGVDVVILHHGVAGGFYGAGMFEEYSDALLEKGCAVVRVNNRGHDPLSSATVGEERKRFGAAYEVVDECRHDWKAWIDFAEAQGYRRIGLWGHSLGAVKSIYYMAVQPDPRVTCTVASSPPRFSYSAYLGMEEGEEFKALADQARQYVDAGHPEALMEVIYPRENVFTAAVFLDKYGPEERYNILRYIPNVKVPLLVTIGGAEGVETGQGNSKIGFAGLAAEVQKLEGELENVTFHLIPGGDHAYTHQREYAWNVISGWLEGV